MVSMSMTSMLPKPDSARSFSSSQPRPPAPTHSTRADVCGRNDKRSCSPVAYINYAYVSRRQALQQLVALLSGATIWPIR